MYTSFRTKKNKKKITHDPQIQTVTAKGFFKNIKLPLKNPIVICCHLGIDSWTFKAASFAKAHGFSHTVLNT